MAEAARNVRHYVSDCLAERHPYDVRKAFAGRPDRDRGLVYAGLQPCATDNWIACISDPSVGDAQRVRAVRLLTAHSASQELKISLLRKGTVLVLAAALRDAPSPDFECAAHSLLRSLCVLPQGCAAVIAGGGLAAALRSVRDRSDAEARGAARTAAAQALRQLCACVAGARWLLAADFPRGFELSPPDPVPLAVARALADSVPDSVPGPAAVVDALVAVARSDADGSPRALLHAVAALALLCAQTEGIFAALRGDVLGAVGALLRRDAADPSRLAEADAAAVATESLAVVWNIALEQSGVDRIDADGLPETLFQLLAALHAQSPTARGPLLRALTGALSAVYKLLSVKRCSLDPLDGTRSRIGVLFEFLRAVNAVVDEARREEREPHVDIVAMSKNVVMCVRLASEVKAVRDFAHAYLHDMASKGGNEAFYFRRQLYYSTIWETEFDAAV